MNGLSQTSFSENTRETAPVKAQAATAVVESAETEAKSAHRRARPGSEAHAARQANWLELKEQAILAYESGLLPRSVDSPQKAITIALMGREFNLSPMQALCGIYVVNGMTALRGSLMLRLIYERVAGAQVNVLTSPDQANVECAVEMKRPGNKPQVFRFTIEDAKKAGFLGKPIWQQHTATMLRWAAIRTGARVVFADAIAGCYMEDELPAEAAVNNAMPFITAEQPPVVVKETVENLPPPNAVAESVEAAASTSPAPLKAEFASTDLTSSFASSASETVRPTPYRSHTDSRGVTDKQVNRLFAIAHSKEWSRQEVTHWMVKMYAKRDPRHLTRAEYDRLCNFLLAGPAKGSQAPEGLDSDSPSESRAASSRDAAAEEVAAF